jgi:hypothetical protein
MTDISKPRPRVAAAQVDVRVLLAKGRYSDGIRAYHCVE